MNRSTLARLVLMGLLLALLASLTACQTSTPTRPNHGAEEVFPGSGMPHFTDGSR